ncbi:MAG: insulinase family protein, partial [Calditrichaeota bacterium]|nr:insulinase family protein [Calditrichota bacterium]
RQNRYDINALAAVLRIKLRETLREDKGGTYGVSVGANPARDPHPEYEFSISFGCAPERVDELTQLVFQQIDSLKQAGIDPSYVQKVQETQRRKNETDLKRNGYWLNVLEFYDSHQESLLGILETDDYIDRLTPETIRQAAGRYLNLEN